VDMLGKIKFDQRVYEDVSTIEIDMSKMNDGLYFLRIREGENQFMLRVIKQ
jgi:hypothetical protein